MYPWLIHQFQHLSERAELKRLHHALLFYGEPGIGKQHFAEQLAEVLLCNNKQATGACGQCQACKLVSAGAHPDYHRLQSDKQIGVDAVREAIQTLSAKAQLSAAKVLIICAVDSMTESAANALLKTLEEPTADTYLILVTDNAERLLPTIISRCEKVRLHTPDTDQCLMWLQQQGHQGINADFASLYSNAPLRILADLEDEEGLDYQSFQQNLDALRQGQSNPLQLAIDWQKQSLKVVTWLQHWCTQRERESGQTEQFWLLYQKCYQAKQSLLHPGVNKVVILTGLFELLQS